MESLTDMRPKLRRDSVFLQTRDGIFLQSDEAAFILKGKNIYRLLVKLSPYMNGEYTLEELCQGLEAPQQGAIVNLVQTLLQRGVLKNHSLEAPGLLPEAVAHFFRSQIEFIDHYVDDPIKRFKAFRESHILLIGAGESFLALAASLIQNGVRELFLACQEAADSHLRRLENKAEAARQAGIEMQLTRVDADLHSSAFAEHLAACEIAIYCSDVSSFKEVVELQQNCRQAGCLFLPVVFFQGQVTLGPLVEAQGPCWLCAQIRLAANADEDRKVAIWRALALDNDVSTQDVAFSPALTRQVGSATGFEIFKKVTEALPSELVNGVICQDSETLETHHGPLAQYPLCPVCSQMTPALWAERTLEIVTGSRDRAPLEAEELHRQSNALIHTSLGILHSYEDDVLTQIPLKVSRLQASSPAVPASKPIDVIAFHTGTSLDARIGALKEALQQYVNSLPDTRSMLLTSADELETRGETPLTASGLSLWSGASSPEYEDRCEWLPAFSLAKRDFCYVPAAAVYPFSSLNRRYFFEKTSAGSATGTSFEDILLSGLTSALAYEDVQKVVHGCCPMIKLEADTLEDIDTDLTFLLRSLKHFERPFTLFEVASSSPLRVVIGSALDAEERAHYGIGFGLSGVQAAQRALLHLVGNLQLLRYEGFAYNPDALFFPDFTLSLPPVLAPAGESRFGEPTRSLPELEDYLREQRRDILFVNTATSDIWTTGVFVSGKILLTRPVKQGR